MADVMPLDLGFDPSDPAFIANPYPVYERLRDDHPILWNPATSQWLISRHADVNRLLRDRGLGRTYLHQASHAEMGRPEPPAWHAPFHELNDAGMLDLEPPDHTRLRRLVLKAFTPRTVEAMRPRIQAIVNGLLDALAGAGEIDLIADYVEPLPVTVIAELLGIPEADRHHLRPWSRDICLMYELEPPEASARKAVQASIEFGDYLRGLLAERRDRPGDDLISALAAVVDDGDTLTEQELIATCVLLLNAGHEASVNGAGNGWWTLFRHPDALERMRAEPALLPTAIEELLRFDTPLSLFERWVLSPVEIDGVTLDRGDEVAMLFGSANRDSRAFERADDLDLARDPNPYLSFGAGIHYCLGAPLAKLELGIAFETLLRRAPRLELVEAPRWKPTFVLRGLESLRVRT
jgi:unspecific monooxygenase